MDNVPNNFIFDRNVTESNKVNFYTGAGYEISFSDQNILSALSSENVNFSDDLKNSALNSNWNTSGEQCDKTLFRKRNLINHIIYTSGKQKDDSSLTKLLHQYYYQDGDHNLLFFQEGDSGESQKKFEYKNVDSLTKLSHKSDHQCDNCHRAFKLTKKK